MKAAIYARISDDRGGSGLGVKRQEDDARRLCADRGWEVVEVFVDNDISAYSGKRRPAYERMLEAIKAGEVEVVVAWHPDRLHRRPAELEDFITLLDATGATVATVTAGELDLSSASGRMAARIVGAVARHESEHKSERIRRKHRELAEAGSMVGGGTRPFGYEEDRIRQRPEEAELIREAARRILAGDSVRSVAMDWTERGIAPVKGGAWHAGSLRNMLIRSRIAGLRSHHGQVVAKGECDAIIDEVTHRRLVQLLTHPQRRLNATRRAYLLTGGLARCGRCDAALVARPSDDKQRQYVCAKGPGFSGCGRLSIKADPLEAFVEALVRRRLADGRVVRRMKARPDTEHGLSAELLRLEADMDRLAVEHYSEGATTKAQFVAASQALQRRIDALERRIAGSRRHDVIGAARTDLDIGSTWDDLSLHRRRAIAEALVERVVVGPAVKGRNFFDADRVEVVWR